MKSILVIGSNGYLGNHLMTHLKRIGQDVYGLDQSNLADTEDLVSKCTLIIFANGLSNHEIGKSNPLFDYQKNVQDFMSYLELSAFRQKQVLYLGSLCQYGYLKGRVKETYPVKPLEPQGLNKQYIEDYLYYLAKTQNIRYTSLRLGAVIGGKTTLSNLSLLEKLLLKHLKNETVEIWGGLNRCYSYLTIQEFLKVCEKIVLHSIFENEIYNCSFSNIKFSSLQSFLNNIHIVEKNIQSNFSIDNSKLLQIISCESSLDVLSDLACVQQELQKLMIRS